MKIQDISIIKEGTTECFVFKKKRSSKGPGSKDNKPFYNPAMELNRDLSIVFVQWLINKSKKSLHLLDGLAASGIRGIRFVNEIDGEFEITINDWNEQAFSLIKKNIDYNKLKNVNVANRNLNELLSEKRYDYIDIDPFGSPAYFIDSAIRSVYNNGLIACTATDTAPLCGIYPDVCFRRYGAQPFHCYAMHEIGLRILLGFICREAAKYDKGIKPILSYSTDYYFRLYVKVKNGKRYANESMKNFSSVNLKKIISVENENKVGPLWLGKLQDKDVVQEIRTLLFKKELNTKNSLWKIISLLEDEANVPIFFHTSDNFASMLKTSPKKLEEIFEKLKDKGYLVTRTHFSPTGFKTDAPLEKIIKILK